MIAKISARRSRLLRLGPVVAALALSAATSSAFVAPQSASAYTHEWACFEYAYERCFDNTGKTFNHWHLVSFDGTYTGGYCAKGAYGEGQQIVFSCTSGKNYATGVVCTNTETHAYGYSDVNGETEAGYANTEGGC